MFQARQQSFRAISCHERLRQKINILQIVMTSYVIERGVHKSDAQRYLHGRKRLGLKGATAMPIRLIQGASFDAETTRLLGLAYERACEGLAPDVTVREAVAKRIIVAAKGGERDVERLIKYGLGKDDMLADAGAQRGQERLASQ